MFITGVRLNFSHLIGVLCSSMVADFIADRAYIIGRRLKLLKNCLKSHLRRRYFLGARLLLRTYDSAGVNVYCVFRKITHSTNQLHQPHQPIYRQPQFQKFTCPAKFPRTPEIGTSVNRHIN